jgi:hypothetical protein
MTRGVRVGAIIIVAASIAIWAGCTAGDTNDFTYEVHQSGNTMVYRNTSGRNLTNVKIYADGKSVKRSRFSAGSTERIDFVTFGIRPGIEVQTTMIICDQGSAVRNR